MQLVVTSVIHSHDGSSLVAVSEDGDVLPIPCDDEAQADNVREALRAGRTVSLKCVLTIE